jgi:AcrR family transcriptional regulator
VQVVERTSLSRAAILDRALAVADAEGLGAVGVRRLARELGVTPMALYWHFESKQELLHALGDRLLADLDLSLDRGATWLERLHALVGSLMAVLRAHPSAAGLIAELPTSAEHALAATEAALQILRDGGFTPQEAVDITEQIVRVTTSIAAAGFEPSHSVEAEAAKRERFRALGAERFPRIHEAAGPLSRTSDREAFYALGVELLVAGIEALGVPDRRVR